MVRELRFVLERTDLTLSEKVVLCYLQLCAGDKLICYPSYSAISQGCGLSRIHVCRTIKSLKLKGWIEVSPCVGRRTNMYRLKIKERMGNKVNEHILAQAIMEAEKRAKEIQNNITSQQEKTEQKDPEKIDNVIKNLPQSYWAKLTGLSDEEIERLRKIAKQYLKGG